MMHLLLRYARDHGLPEAGFGAKTIRWALAFTSEGRFVGLQELGDASQRRNPGREFARCPEMPANLMQAGGMSHFLAETASVVALHEADQKAESKHRFFTGLLRQASDAAPDLACAAAALDDPDTLATVQAHLAERKAKGTDKVTLQIAGSFPLEGAAWHDWWRAYRSNLMGREDRKAGRMVCFATGDLVEPAATFPKVSSLSDVGGIGMGSPLVGFDKDAFPSFGLQQSANAATSEDAAAACTSALNHLIRSTGQRLAGAKVVHWYSAPVAPDDDPYPWLEDPPEQAEAAAQQRAAELLAAIRAGRRPELAEARYQALTLSANGGRVMLRDWMEGSFEDLVAAVLRWFDDLAIVRRDGSGNAPPPKLAAVLAATARELGDVPAPAVARLWRTALRGEPVPTEFMAQALTRARIDVVKGNPANHARMGLLRCYHVRQGGHRMQPALDVSYPDAAYHCGRLMAVLAALQNAAQGDVDAGVVQRYYAAASATPALVLGRLSRLSKFHLNKLSPGLAAMFEDRLADIYSRISPASLPATLSLARQSLFALGYYHQMAHDRAARAERAAQKKAEAQASPEDNINA